MTNFEKIKQMSVEEMAVEITKRGCDFCLLLDECKCGGCGFALKWLESEADTGQREGERE